MGRNAMLFWACACLIVLSVFTFVLVSRSEVRIKTDLVCETKWAVVTSWSGGQLVGSRSTPYTECYYIGYMVDVDPSGGGGGGVNPYDPDDQPSGGGGPVPPVIYDTNNNGYVDCYQTAIFHTTSLTITSTCEELRDKGIPHNALDLWVPDIDGKAAYSICNGTVNKIDVQLDEQNRITGWGYYVEIKDAAGNIWRYAHLKGTDADPSGVGLEKGDTVIAGITKVGLCDTSGTKDAHLHLEYWVNGVTKTCPTTKLGNCESKA